MRSLARAAVGEGAYEACKAGRLALEAAAQGDVEVLGALLDGGVDVDFSDEMGWFSRTFCDRHFLIH